MRRLALMLLIALPALALADPPSVADQIAQLSARAYKTREAATEALIARGPAALPALRQALAASTSAEASRRLRLVIAEIPLRAIKGVGGVMNAVGRPLLREGGNLTVRVVLVNNTTQRVVLARCLGDGAYHARLERLSFVTGGKVARVIGLRDLAPTMGCGTGLPQVLTALAPGGRLTITHTLRARAPEALAPAGGPRHAGPRLVIGEGQVGVFASGPTTFGPSQYGAAVPLGDCRLRYQLIALDQPGNWKGKIELELPIRVTTK